MPAIRGDARRWDGGSLFDGYGFLDAFNPTFRLNVPVQPRPRSCPAIGWFDTDYLGIDQGPIVAMIENCRERS